MAVVQFTTQQIAKKLPVWQKDPIVFFKDVIPKFKPTEQQKLFIRAIAESGAWVSVKSGHGVGKTASMACLALWFLSVFPNAIVPVTSPSSDQLKLTMWKALRDWRSEMIPQFRERIEISAEKVSISGSNGYIVARTARKENPDALQGFHDEYVLFLVDEASGVPSEIFEVAIGALTTEGSRFLLTGNPTQNVGYFHDTFRSDRKGKKKWKNFTLSCKDSPLVHKDYVDNMISEFGEDSNEFRVRVLGEFPEEGNMQFISRALVDKALLNWHTISKNKELYEFQPKILGVDVARYGNDKSCLVLRQGLYSEVLHVISKNSITELARLVAHEHDKHGFLSICVDVGGVGAGVVDYLLDRDYPVISVNFGSNAEEPDKHHLKRTEIWSKAKEWLGRGGLAQNDVLAEDLVSPEYSFTAKGAIELESKDRMKKRLKRSPDIGDAFALTFADIYAFEDDADEDDMYGNMNNGGNVVTCNDVDLFTYASA